MTQDTRAQLLARMQQQQQQQQQQQLLQQQQQQRLQQQQQQQQAQQQQAQPPPSSQSQSAQQQQYNQYSKMLTNDREFLLKRSPFFETISRHCVMPIHQRQVIQFQFNLPPNFVSDIEQSAIIHLTQTTEQKNGGGHGHGHGGNSGGSNSNSNSNGGSSGGSNSGGGSTDSEVSPDKQLQIRLFNLRNRRHESWDKNGWELNINGRIVGIDALLGIKKPVSSKPKKKKNNEGFKYVRALNISQYAVETMKFQIICKKHAFFGAAAIEIVNVVPTDTIAQRIDLRSELSRNANILFQEQLAQQQNKQTNNNTNSKLKARAQKKAKKHPNNTHQCRICSKTGNLSRCSRCKSIWYCSREHQAQDWNTHHNICLPFLQLKDLQLNTSSRVASNHSTSTTNNTNTNANANNPSAEGVPEADAGDDADDNDDVICGEIRVSLRDPLTLCRISKPVRGIECVHPQCMDLNTFLEFSKNCHVWKCPVCSKAITYDALLIDYNMKTILSETAAHENIDVVRLLNDGTFQSITYKELEAEENRRQNSMLGKKRKYNNRHGHGAENANQNQNQNSHAQHANGHGNQPPVQKRHKANGNGSESTSVPGGHTISTAIVLE